MNYKKIALIVVSIIVAGLGAFALNQQKGINTQATVSKEVEATKSTGKEPQRTEFNTNIPNGFPADIPAEAGAKLEQSYSLNYVGQKQLTIVFLSTKTIMENYALYTDFLLKQGWTTGNKYESAKVSSLYGVKGSNDINITISENSSTGSKSQVSISILKK